MGRPLRTALVTAASRRVPQGPAVGLGPQACGAVRKGVCPCCPGSLEKMTAPRPTCWEGTSGQQAGAKRGVRVKSAPARLPLSQANLRHPHSCGRFRKIEGRGANKSGPPPQPHTPQLRRSQKPSTSERPGDPASLALFCTATGWGSNSTAGTRPMSERRQPGLEVGGVGRLSLVQDSVSSPAVPGGCRERRRGRLPSTGTASGKESRWAGSADITAHAEGVTATPTQRPGPRTPEGSVGTAEVSPHPASPFRVTQGAASTMNLVRSESQLLQDDAEAGRLPWRRGWQAQHQAVVHASFFILESSSPPSVQRSCWTSASGGQLVPWSVTRHLTDVYTLGSFTLENAVYPQAPSNDSFLV